MREQFEILVNLAVVTNVVPYVLCILAVPTMMRMAGVAESRIKRSNYLFGIGVLYCLYAIYACGFDAMVGSAVAVSIGLVIYVLRKAWDTRRAHRLQQSID